MIFLGIDAGFQKTGWSILSKIQYTNKFTYINSGIIQTKNHSDDSNALLYINEMLSEVIVKYTPHYAAIEKTYVNANFSTSLKLAQAKAASMIACAKYNISLNEYQASTIKKIITGNGNASKLQIKKMIELQFRVNHIRFFDETDAVAIALCDLLLRH